MAERPTQRRLAAILAADVVGYSRMMEIDEAGTMATLKTRRKEVLEPLVAQHEGRIFKVTGDGVFVEFGSAVSAVQCAIDLQKGMTAANGGLPGASRITLRIGINLGDVIVEGGDLYGDSVNIAARLEAIADPGGVVISSTAYDYVKNKIKVGFEDIGGQSLKNIAEPVRAYRVAQGLLVATKSAEPADKPAVAVLPFENLSGDPEQLYFSRGITADIIGELSRFHDILVTSKTSSFALEQSNISLRDIAARLGVNYVVEGSVRKAGNRVRVAAQLIDAETMNHAWAEHYDRDLADVFELQDELAHKIAATVAGRVKLARTDRAHRKRTENMSAYDNYLRALELWGFYDRFAPAEPFLLKAVEIDPRFALAHARLSMVNTSLYFIDGDKSRLRKAENYGRQAVALDDSEGLCHAAIAHPLIFQKRFDEAARHFERAVELNSNDTFIMMAHALWFIYTGQSAEALSVVEAARRRDPFAHDWYWDVQGMAQTGAGLYAEALVSYRHMKNAPPWSHAYMAICHMGLDQLPEARSAAAQFVAHDTRATIAHLLDEDPYTDSALIARFRAALLAAGVPEA